MFYFFLAISLLLLAPTLLIYAVYKRGFSIPFLNRLIRNAYLKSRFKIWDDLEKAKLKDWGEKYPRKISELKFKLHKSEATFYYYLALLFKSSKDSFILLNCDHEPDQCQDNDYPKHLAKQKQVVTLSVMILCFLVLANISTGLIASFIFPNIFKTKADTYTQTDYPEFLPGTLSSVDITTNPGDITLSRTATSTWASDKEISTGGNEQFTSAVSDGADGMILFWKNETGTQIYAQKVDSSGNTAWPVGGVTVGTSTGYTNVDGVQAVSDDLGGAIVMWSEDGTTGTTSNIFAQRIDPSGNRSWAEDVAVASTSLKEIVYYPRFSKYITSDTANGAIISYFIDKSSTYELHTQRLDSSGSLLWAGGTTIWATSSVGLLTFYSAQIASDGAGGAVFTLAEYPDSQYNLYAQKVSNLGAIEWAEGGVLVSASSTKSESFNSLYYDSSANDTIVVFTGGASPNTDVYAQKLDFWGNWQWPDSNKILDAGSLSIDLSNIIPDGSGNFLAVISKYVGPSPFNEYFYNLVAQKINSNGEPQWDSTNGALVSDTIAGHSVPVINSDGAGGAFVSWLQRNSSSDYRIYAQRINSNGGAVWDSSGVEVAASVRDYIRPYNVISDNGTIIIGWWDERSGNKVYAQKLHEIYYSSGIYTSPVIDASSTVAWNTLTDSHDTPPGTSIDYETRTTNSIVSYPNLALTGSASANSTLNSYVANGAIDGNNTFENPTFSAWVTNPDDSAPWELTVTLDATSTVNYIKIYFASLGGNDYVCADYTIRVSSNSSNWSTVASTTSNTNLSPDNTFNATSTQLIKFNCTSAPLGLLAITEFEIYEGQSAWTSWEALSGLSGNDIQSADGRYIQYRANLSTTNTNVTPTISEVTLDYGSATGTEAIYVIGQSNMISGSANQGGTVSSTTISIPAGIYSYNGKFFVADNGNNRVLIYNSIPTSNNAPADVVIGQEDFTHNSANQGGSVASTTLYSPAGLWVQDGKLFIADQRNNRVLIYNSIPTSNGAAADVVIGQTDFISNSAGVTDSKFFFPNGVVSDGTKLYITEFGNNRVLIYNSIPTTNGEPASVVIGQADFTHNSTNQGGNVASTTLFNPSSTYVSGGKLFINDFRNHRVLIYNSIPTSNNAPADVVVGQADFTHNSANQGGSVASTTLSYPSSATVRGNKLYIADAHVALGGNQRVLIYDSIPTSNNAPADVVIGQGDFTSNTANQGFSHPYANTVYGAGVAYNDGTYTYVSDMNNNRVLMFYDPDLTPLDTTPPTVQSVSPINQNNNVDINTTLSAIFSEDLATSTVTTTTFTLSDGTRNIFGTVDYASSTATFTSASPLQCFAHYTATLTTGITDLAANPMASDYTWSFDTTCASVSGAPGAPSETKTPATTTTEPVTATSTSTVATTISPIVATSTSDNNQPLATSTQPVVTQPANNSTPTSSNEPANQASQSSSSVSSGSNAASGGTIPAVSTGATHVSSTTISGTSTTTETNIVSSTTNFNPVPPVVVSPVVTFTEVRQAVASSTAAAAGTAALAATFVALTALQFASQVNSASQIPSMFFNLLGFVAYRRKRRAGLVYDAITGQPVPFAKVTVYDKATGAAKETKVTDKNGSYFFLVPKGEYTIQATKKGYGQLKEQDMAKAKTTYASPYAKGKVLKYEHDDIINVNIPIQQTEELALLKFFAKPTANSILNILFVAGLIASLIMTIANPVVLNFSIIVVYLILAILKYFNLAIPQWGIVSAMTGQTQPFTVVEALEADTKKMFGRTVSDEHGRYAFILDKGKFSLEARAATGHTESTSITVNKRKLVGKDIKL